MAVGSETQQRQVETGKDGERFVGTAIAFFCPSPGKSLLERSLVVRRGWMRIESTCHAAGVRGQPWWVCAVIMSYNNRRPFIYVIVFLWVSREAWVKTCVPGINVLLELPCVSIRVGRI